MKIIKKENLPVFEIVGGISLIIFGLMYDIIFARIPYQGSTPETMQRVYFRISFAESMELIGITLLTISIIAFVIKKFSTSNDRE